MGEQASIAIGICMIVIICLICFLDSLDKPIKQKVKPVITMGFCRSCGEPLEYTMTKELFDVVTGEPNEYVHLLKCKDAFSFSGHHTSYIFRTDVYTEPVLNDFIVLGESANQSNGRLVSLKQQATK